MQNIKVKIIGIAAIVGTTLLFIIMVTNENYEKTGGKSFSPFSGWQLANNALYMYNHVAKSPNYSSDPEVNKLDAITLDYFKQKSTSDNYSITQTYYLWNNNAPLKKYLFQFMKERNMNDSIKAWCQIGPTLSEYGKRLILKNPLPFMQFFVLPNIKEYLYPKLEVLKYYNQGVDTVNYAAMAWFKYDGPRVNSKFEKQQASALSLYPGLFAVINISFIFFLIMQYARNRNKLTKFSGSEILLLISLFALINFLFSIASAPVTFRYQYFPMFICFIGLIILINNNVNFIERPVKTKKS